MTEKTRAVIGDEIHSWVAVVVVAALSTWLTGGFGAVVPVVITLAYTSHLAADVLTKSGIEFLLPIKKSIHLAQKFLRAKTGGLMDTILFIIGALALVVLYLLAVRNGQFVS
ncbi:MAG: metal-dependent hydrolase [bacterium]